MQDTRAEAEYQKTPGPFWVVSFLGSICFSIVPIGMFFLHFNRKDYPITTSEWFWAATVFLLQWFIVHWIIWCGRCQKES